MFIPNYPEDSVLRRHYEAAAARRRQSRLREPPADSVLRRHFRQLEQVRRMPSSPASAKLADTARSTKTVSATVPKTEPGATQQPTKNPAKGGGLFSRLKRFFSS
ncbi:MAG: hypothetical protein WBM40_19830 [Thiohalocapsa sp.]